jgi:hypothetical protein
VIEEFTPELLPIVTVREPADVPDGADAVVTLLSMLMPPLVEASAALPLTLRVGVINSTEPPATYVPVGMLIDPVLLPEVIESTEPEMMLPQALA